MERADWEQRWEQGQIGFHQPTFTRALTAHAARVFGDERMGRVLVPLCGKSLDLVYLADLADEVVGVEFVEQAVREFFDERRLEPSVDDAPPVRYEAGPFRLFAADLFAIGREHLGPVDAVFDRAALVALDAPTRIRYAAHLAALLDPGARMLLVTFDYEQSQMGGPPFAVVAGEVEGLFGRDFTIEHLETTEVLDDDFRARGVTFMTESVYALTRR